METSGRSGTALAQAPVGPKYQPDELLAMRHLAVYPIAYLEKLMEEDCLKHLLLKVSMPAHRMPGKHETERSGNSSGSSFSTGASSRTVVNGGVNAPKELQHPTGGSKKPSPSPSIKRGKAERLLKEHGSPPGMRVTAGGRIVPTEFNPLGTPQVYGPKGSKLGFHRELEPTVPHGFIGYDQKGQLCQKFGNSLLPVKIVNGVPQFYTPPVNSFPTLPSTTDVSHPQGSHSLFSGFPLTSMPIIAPGFPMLGGPTPFGSTLLEGSLTIDAQIQFLESEYTRLDKERQEFERYEVLKKESLPPAGREGLVNRKRKYVLDLDQLRKSIKNLKAMQITGISNSHMPYGTNMSQGQFNAPAAPVIPPFSLYPQSLGMYAPPGPRFFPTSGFGGTGTDPSLGAYPQFPMLPADGNSGLHIPEVETKPAPAPRRSHAVEITNPANRTKSRRGLDPTSPDYIPGKPVRPAAAPVASSTSPALPASGHVKNKASNSSVTTSAFFPVNTHEHSSAKPAGGSDKKSDSMQSSADTEDAATAAAPSTPAKTWNDSQKQCSNQGTDSSANQSVTAEAGREMGPSGWKHSCNLSSDQQSAFSETAPLHASVKSSFSVESSDVRKAGIGPIENVPPGTESFLDGYCDGLARKAPSHLDKSTDYLNGYCQGLHRYQKRPENELRWSSEDSKFKPLGPSSISMNSVPDVSVADSEMATHSSAGWSLSQGQGQGQCLPEALRLANAIAEKGLAGSLSCHLLSNQHRLLHQQQPQQLLHQQQQVVKSHLAVKGIRHHPGNAIIYGSQPFAVARSTVSTGPIYNQRGWPSGCDGVMDEVSDPASGSPHGGDVDVKGEEGNLVMESKSKGRNSVGSGAPTAAAAVSGVGGGSGGGAGDGGAGMAAGSPNKKTSPAKIKLEQLTHRVRRKEGNNTSCSGEGAGATTAKTASEDRRKRWRLRFEKIKKMDQEEIQQYQRDHPLPPSS